MAALARDPDTTEPRVRAIDFAAALQELQKGRIFRQ
jgi:hypothetical protein